MAQLVKNLPAMWDRREYYVKHCFTSVMFISYFYLHTEKYLTYLSVGGRGKDNVRFFICIF